MTNLPTRLFSLLERERQACRAMIAHSLYQRLSQGGIGLTWVLGVTGVLLCGLFGAATGQWREAIGFCAGIPLALLLLAWWPILVGGVMTQYTTSAARLVPHMRVRLVLVSVLLWALGTLSMAMTIGTALGRPGFVFVLAGLVLIQLALFLASRIWLAYLAVSGFLQLGLVAQPPLLENFLASDAAIAPGLVLLALTGWLALDRMFRAPDPLGRRFGAPKQLGQPGASRLIPYGWFLQRDCARGTPSRLFPHVFGPNLHPVETGVTLLFLLAAAIAVRAWAGQDGAGPAHERLAWLRTGAVCVFGAMPAMVALQMVSLVYRTHPEQALLRLAAKAPPAARLNRALAAVLLLRFTVSWSGMAALTVLVAALLGASAPEAARIMAASTLSLLLAPMLLRDYARRSPAEPGMRIFWWMGAAVGLGALGLAVHGKGAAGWWLAASVASIVCVLLFAAVRWRWMMAAAPALPAGRGS